MTKVGICPPLHVKAILYRKWLTIKRSGATLLLSCVAALVFCSLAIVCFYLMRSLMKPKLRQVDFTRYGDSVNRFFMITESGYMKSSSNADKLETIVKDFYKEDTGKSDIIFEKFESEAKAQALMYELGKDLGKNPSYGFGFTVDDYNLQVMTASMPTYHVLGYINKTETQKDLTTFNTVALTRIMWRHLLGGRFPGADFKYYVVKLLRRLADYIFAYMGPMLISDGLLSMLPMIISPVIIDVCGEVRSYMVSCTLKLLPYWISTFIVDYAFWFIVTTLVWALFVVCQIQCFLDNLFLTWYVLVFGGISFILFIYCFSFCFNNPESASRQAFLVLIIAQLVPVIVYIIRNYDENPLWLEYMYALFPHICMMQCNTFITQRLGIMTEPISWYYKEKHTKPHFLFIWVDIPIYIVLLFLIEFFRITFQRKKAKASFGNYTDFFEQQKAKHPVTQEAKDMDELVHNDTDWAVRIYEVSRLFLNTAGQPIPAVNKVSLGVRKGSLFGFLGANGAGKTTLIKMITSLLPPSAGHIEIEGVDITQLTDPTLLSICPQFNTHLIDEMTPLEHFKLYSMIFMLPQQESEEKTKQLFEELELDELKDKPIRELSGGDVRKLAIALCFLGPARIILLDEPTASLDPVVRRHVQEMLLQYKGEKTFMLCTHLLSEAEFLCDTISIMIKGNVYTVGSPAYLSQKFGTEFKVDVMLSSSDEECGTKCDAFFQKELPTAMLTIQREKARIYSIPASDTTLPDLFEIMQNGMNGDNGYSYYTCSSSSLERVFMEIVHISEGDEGQFLNADVKVEKFENEKEKSQSVSKTQSNKEQEKPSVKVEKFDEKNSDKGSGSSYYSDGSDYEQDKP